MKTELLGAIGGGGGAKVVPLPNEGDKVTTEVPSLIGAWQAGRHASAYADVVSGVRLVTNSGSTASISDLKFTELPMVDAGHTVTLKKRATASGYGGGCTSSSCRSNKVAA